MRFSRLCPLALSGVFLFAACSRQPTASSASRYVPAPPTIDGQAADWTDSLRYDPGSKLQYQVLNDGRMVYVRLKAADPATQAKIVRLGLTVWLDTTGRNQHQFGVHYPLGNLQAGRGAGGEGNSPRPDNPDASGTDRQASRRARLTQALADMREMELLNYKGSKEPTLTDAQSQLGVKAAIGLNEQEDLIYELAVPMRLLYRKLPALATGQSAVVGVSVAGGKFTMPSQGGGGGMQGGGMGGGGMRGGMGGGGMRGGGGGGMRGGGGGMRGGGGYGGGQQMTPLALKTSVQLSSH
ncbi:hypothetical protein [Hymenobacter rubidus]|uniref:hypothetical protein n=1 Tax=Hymenobacter rubidus TaxID=1441626 RepID=UPI00191F8CB5|nr:hypothetical protein [Hymenobacter rubidus]